MPRALMKVVDLEEGMPRVNEALLRLDRELVVARQQGFALVKIIHGYGSTGVGGTLRIEIQKSLRQRVSNSQIRDFIPGEEWRVSNESAWALVKSRPELKQDADFGRGNLGISIIVL
ncbi:MAG TPA: Smr/MutS family protein [Terriglobales bacterium]|nr:Smr/MutS family protein [Terriglobales bacterium]